MPTMRAKLRVSNIQNYSPESESLTFNAVCKADGYPADGSDENNSFARWTPTAELKMSITNPNLVGKFTVGQEYYLDFTPA
jgi:hypothetical protein